MVPPRDSESDRAKVEPLTSEATIDLLEMVKQGNDEALEKLLSRCMPALRRWAHRRLPASARGMQETADLVQDATFAAIRHLDGFQPRHQGALQAYLRKAVMHRIVDLIRQQHRRPQQVEMPEQLVDGGASPLERAIGADNIARYERALQRLSDADQEAIIGRVELQHSYKELAVILDVPSPDAARMAVKRAIERLMVEMKTA